MGAAARGWRSPPLPPSLPLLQIAVGELDPSSGVYTKKSRSYALSGFVRFKVCVRAARARGCCPLLTRRVLAQGMSDEAVATLVAADEKEA